jgi:hypothetical protein
MKLNILLSALDKVASDAERSGSLRHYDGSDTETEDIIAEFSRRLHDALTTDYLEKRACPVYDQGCSFSSDCRGLGRCKVM